MYSMSIPKGTQTQSLTLDQLSSGIYLYTIKNDQQMVQGKLVKE